MNEAQTIESILKSTPTVKTNVLEQVLGRTARTLYRWQDQEAWQNTMPRPFSSARSVGNIYDSGKILAWFKTLPMKKRNAS